MKSLFLKLNKEKVKSMNSPSTSSASEELPQVFNVRYLGFRESKGLWGIKHTRKPVDAMVTSVKESHNNLHVIKLIIAKDGCKLESIYNNKIETRYAYAHNLKLKSAHMTRAKDNLFVKFDEILN